MSKARSTKTEMSHLLPGPTCSRRRRTTQQRGPEPSSAQTGWDPASPCQRSRPLSVVPWCWENLLGETLTLVSTALVSFFPSQALHLKRWVGTALVGLSIHRQGQRNRFITQTPKKMSASSEGWEEGSKLGSGVKIWLQTKTEHFPKELGY